MIKTRDKNGVSMYNWTRIFNCFIASRHINIYNMISIFFYFIRLINEMLYMYIGTCNCGLMKINQFFFYYYHDETS